MAHIKPFRALRPHNEFAAQLASRPYDVLSSDEARTEAEGNLLSFLHITKAEIDLPREVDVHAKEVYQKAKENLEHFIKRKVLFQDETPCYYIYELQWQGRTQTGLVCVSSVADYFNDVIKKHEHTRPEKEQDRIDHMRTIRAQTGNVFLACNDLKELHDLFEHWKKRISPNTILLRLMACNMRYGWCTNWQPLILSPTCFAKKFRTPISPTAITVRHQQPK